MVKQLDKILVERLIQHLGRVKRSLRQSILSFFVEEVRIFIFTRYLHYFRCLPT